jgi:hypothetical protein
VQLRCDYGGIFDASHVVQLDVCLHGRGHSGRYNASLGGLIPVHPRQNVLGISDRCRESDSLWLAVCDLRGALQNCQKMPLPVIASKGVDFVNDYRIASRLSAVVSKMSGGSRRIADREACPTRRARARTADPPASNRSQGALSRLLRRRGLGRRIKRSVPATTRLAFSIGLVTAPPRSSLRQSVRSEDNGRH